jgi:hypothetical protein
MGFHPVIVNWFQFSSNINISNRKRTALFEKICILSFYLCIVYFSLPGRPIVKGSGFSGNTQQQQQPQYFPQEIGRMPQPNMMGMQRMPGGHKIGPQNPMQQQQQPPLYMNQQQQQNMFPQQNRGELIFARNKNKTYAVFLLQTCKLRTTAAAFCCSSFFRANAPSTRSIWPSSSHMVGNCY